MKQKLTVMLGLVGLLAMLLLIRWGLKALCFLALPGTSFGDRCASLIAITVMAAALALVCHRKGVPLCVFPARFGPMYWAFTGLFAALFLLTPILTGDDSREDMLLLAYGAIVTPVFEELLFRGLVWEKLKKVFRSEWAVYGIVTLLFALWHFGYVDSLAMRVQSDLARVMLLKALTGLGFGAVLGLARLKAKNCYAAMLLHGALNILGR